MPVRVVHTVGWLRSLQVEWERPRAEGVDNVIVYAVSDGESSERHETSKAVLSALYSSTEVSRSHTDQK